MRVACQSKAAAIEWQNNFPHPLIYFPFHFFFPAFLPFPFRFSSPFPLFIFIRVSPSTLPFFSSTFFVLPFPLTSIYSFYFYTPCTSIFSHLPCFSCLSPSSFLISFCFSIPSIYFNSHSPPALSAFQWTLSSYFPFKSQLITHSCTLFRLSPPYFLPTLSPSFPPAPILSLSWVSVYDHSLFTPRG